MPTQPTLRRGLPDPRTVDVAASIMGRAFVDDPVFTGTLRDPLRREAALPLTFRGLIRQFAPQGALDLVQRDGRDVGAALWADGQQPDIGLRAALTHGQLRFGLAAGIRDSLRLMRAQNEAARVHHAVICEPHAYLLSLAVLPGHQGQGVGSELLERGLAAVDAQGLPAFLETNLPQNARLYRRHGFVTVRQEDTDGYPTWYMLRPAR